MQTRNLNIVLGDLAFVPLYWLFLSACVILNVWLWIYDRLRGVS